MLETAPLFGGVKVVLAQANLLVRAGHEVRLVCAGERPSWYDLDPEVDWLTPEQRSSASAVDVTVATYWTTIGPAMMDAAAPVAHYCQGFEGSYTHNQDEHGRIAEAYALPAPALAVSDHLARLLRERFRRPARVVVQPLEDWFQPDDRRRPGSSARIGVIGPLEIDWKGVATALETVALLRATGREVELIRISQLDSRGREAGIAAADRYYTRVTPREVAAILRDCDVLLTASWEQEGFGLPALEAMACGVPVVASRVSCYCDWAREAALLAEREPRALADTVSRLLDDEHLWRRHRALGLDTASGYRDEHATQSAIEALSWIASGEWKSELVGADDVDPDLRDAR